MHVFRKIILCLLACLYAAMGRTQSPVNCVDTFLQTEEAAKRMPAAAFDVTVETGFMTDMATTKNMDLKKIGNKAQAQ